MKTTIEIPDRLLDQVREKALREKTTIKAVIQAALRGYLAGEKKRPAKFKIRDGSFKGEGLVPGVEEGNWNQIREIIYEGRGG